MKRGHGSVQPHVEAGPRASGLQSGHRILLKWVAPASDAHASSSKTTIDPRLPRAADEWPLGGAAADGTRWRVMKGWQSCDTSII